MVKYYGRARQRIGSVNTNQLGLKMSGCPSRVGRNPVNARYIKQEGCQPNYILTQFRDKVSRANLISVVISLTGSPELKSIPTLLAKNQLFVRLLGWENECNVINNSKCCKFVVVFV
jgi:hypothetical protein